MKWGRAKEQSGHGAINYKRKHQYLEKGHLGEKFYKNLKNNFLAPGKEFFAEQ